VQPVLLALYLTDVLLASQLSLFRATFQQPLTHKCSHATPNAQAPLSNLPPPTPASPLALPASDQGSLTELARTALQFLLPSQDAFLAQTRSESGIVKTVAPINSPILRKHSAIQYVLQAQL